MELIESLSVLEKRFILITIAFLIDMIVGDPVYPFHPIRILGNWISLLQSALYKLKMNGYFGGCLLWIFTTSLPILFYLFLKYYLHDFYFSGVIDLLIFYTLFSAKDLIKHVSDVGNALSNNGIGDGRKAVSLIVGRNTEQLNESGISKAAVETIAENSSDGIVAPLCYAMLFGPIGIILYKCVNTLDSMVGYKNDKYLKFGFVSAKIDDVFNFIPARITSFLILVPYLFQMGIVRTFWKYKNSHLSPNAGYPESAMAAILNVKMGGPSEYDGKVVQKDYINPNGKDMNSEDIIKSVSIIKNRCYLLLFLLIILSSLILFWK